MYISSQLLDQLSEQARECERLRISFDLRNSNRDQSQRLFNALEPGTIVPIHKHSTSSETVALIRGSVRVYIYLDDTTLSEQFTISSQSSCPFYCIPIGVLHTIECLESGTILFECKDGPYIPNN